MPEKIQHYDDDSVDFAETRKDVEDRLADRIEEVRSGKAIDVLAPYAKVYLGLYLDIDNRNEPHKRVQLLANPELALVILEGFEAVLYSQDLPTTEEIASAFSNDQRLPIGFVVLAGMHRYCLGEEDKLECLSPITRQAALCFHFSNRSNLATAWHQRIMEQYQQESAVSLCEYWSVLVKNNVNALPAFQALLDQERRSIILEYALLPLLRIWDPCRFDILRAMLLKAIRVSDKNQLLQISSEKLVDDQSIPIKKYVLWLTTAFVLSPTMYAGTLSSYTNQTRLKILPMLDFVIDVLNSQSENEVLLDADAIAQLLRIIAPAFTRNEHAQGGLDAISQKVLSLFDRLAEDKSAQASKAIRTLRKVRTMKNYADVLKDIQLRQSQDPV